MNSPSCEIKYPMAYKMKYDSYVPVVRQVALNNVPLKNGHVVLKTLVKNPCSSIVKNDQQYPNKMIVCSGGRCWIFLQCFKVASFI